MDFIDLQHDPQFIELCVRIFRTRDGREFFNKLNGHRELLKELLVSTGTSLDKKEIDTLITLCEFIKTLTQTVTTYE